MTICSQDKIFQSAQQCLHVSFLFEYLPVSQKSSMQAAIEQQMKVCGVWRHEPSTINFSGLEPIEVRGQCAMVRSIVAGLKPVHCAAIWAQYGTFQTKAKGIALAAIAINKANGWQVNSATIATALGCASTRDLAKAVDVSQTAAARATREAREALAKLIECAEAEFSGKVEADSLLF